MGKNVKPPPKALLKELKGLLDQLVAAFMDLHAKYAEMEKKCRGGFTPAGQAAADKALKAAEKARVKHQAAEKKLKRLMKDHAPALKEKKGAAAAVAKIRKALENIKKLIDLIFDAASVCTP